MSTWPKNPVAQGVQLSRREYVNTSLSLSGIEQIRTRNAQRWEARLEYRAMRRSEFAPIKAFALQQGRATAFDIALPGHTRAQYTGTVAARTTAEAATGTGQVTMPQAVAQGLALGDYVRFETHNKVYAVTSISGATVSVAPALRKSVPANTLAIVTNVMFHMRLKSDVFSFRHRRSPLIDCSVDLIEALD